jgi:hypothetical protein
MKFNVYVSSATRYFEEFYRQLGRSQSLCTAASLARKHLASDERRRTSPSAELEDWLVPLVFQAGEDLRFRRDELSEGRVLSAKLRKGGLIQDFFRASRRLTEVLPMSRRRAISDLLIPRRKSSRASAAF